MGKRCQVCDGPVVNGRCKYCGMPYRNDLELYHLNEDRSEHYRHASAKVRKAMAESVGRTECRHSYIYHESKSRTEAEREEKEQKGSNCILDHCCNFTECCSTDRRVLG